MLLSGTGFWYIFFQLQQMFHTVYKVLNEKFIPLIKNYSVRIKIHILIIIAWILERQKKKKFNISSFCRLMQI